MENKSKRQDYFNYNERFELLLPDGESKIIHKKLNEGDRRRFEDETNREISIDQDTRKASVQIRAGTSRHLILEMAIVDWSLMRNRDDADREVQFSSTNLEEFLKNADPSVIDLIYQDIEDKNPWISTVRYESTEVVDREIDRLKGIRERLGKEGK